MLADLLRDLRLAIRSLTKAPGFALAAILTLALGVGATSAIFSVVNGVVLRPMPYPDPDSLVMVWEITPQQRTVHRRAGQLLRLAPAGDDVRGPRGVGQRRRHAPGTERARAGGRRASVSADFFKVMGVRPALGRGFTAEEETPGRDDVIVLSHGAWQRRFGARPARARHAP